GIALLSGGDDEARPAPSPPPAVAPAVPEAPAAPAPAAPSRAPAIDPFAEGVPDALAPMAARVNANRGLTRAQRVAINRYNREHEDDVRGHLLLAHGYVNERALSWAIDIYRELLPEQPEVRGDPRILPDLLEMVRANDRNLHVPAATLVVDTYGEEAADAVVEQLQRDDLRPPERERLLALDARLQALRSIVP